MKKWLSLIVAVAMFAMPGIAAEFKGQTKNSPAGTKTVFEFGANRNSGDFTTEIPSCPSMRITWVRGSGAVVFLMGTKPGDNTLVQIATATTVDTFSTSESIEVPQQHMSYRLLVSIAESIGSVSYAEVTCGTNVGSGSGGAPLSEYAALSSIDEATVSHVTVSDCDDLTCAAPGTGSTHVPFYHNGTNWVPFPGAAAGIASVSADGAPVLGGDLDADGNDITGAAKLNHHLYPSVSTLQAAINSCQRGSNSSTPACVIHAPPGRHGLTTTLELGSDDNISTEMQNGFTLVGAGAGINNSLGNSLSGTTFYWAGADGGTMMKVSGFGHHIADIHFEGRSCVDLYNAGGPPQTSGAPDGFCDSDGSTAQVQAAYGVVQKGINANSAPAGKNHYERLLFTGILDAGSGDDGYAFAFGDGPDVGQNDHSILTQVRMDGNRHCLRQSDTQAVQNIATQTECTNSTASPAILIERGGIVFEELYLNTAASSAVGVQVDSCVTNFRWLGGSVEWTTDNGTVVKISDTGLGCGTGARYTHAIRDVRFQMQQTATVEHTCIEHTTNSDLQLEANMWTSNSSAALRKCDLELTQPNVATDSYVTMLGNKSAWNNGSDSTDVSITNTSASTGRKRIIRNDNGRLVLQDSSGSAGIAKDATGLYADNNANGTFDAGDVRLANITGTLTISGNDISSDGDVTIGLDQNGDGSNTFAIRNGLDISVFSIDESGASSFLGNISSGGTGTFGSLLRSGTQVSIQGGLEMYGGDATFANFNLIKLAPPATGGAGTFRLPPVTGITADYCIKASGTGGDTKWEACGSGIFGTAGAYQTATQDLIIGGDGDATPEATEVAIVDGVVTADSFVARDPGDGDRGITLTDNTSTLEDLDTIPSGDCRLGFVGGDLYKHCNGGSLTAVEGGGGGGIAAGSFLDSIRTKPFYFTDFLGPGASDNGESAYAWLDWNATNSGTTGIAANFASASHPGVVRISASATANSGGAIMTGFSGGEATQIDLDGGEIGEVISQLKVSSGANFRYGFIDTTDADVVDGIYIEISDGLAATCKSANNGTRTTSSTIATLSVDTWYRFRVTVNADKTSATCQIWNDAGTSQGSQSVTTNLPADARMSGFGMHALHIAGSAGTVLAWYDWAGLEFSGRALTR